MTDSPTLLHNSGSPPRSTVKYSGLSGILGNVAGTDKNGLQVLSQDREFGTALVFRLPGPVRGFTAKYLLPLCVPEENRSAPEKTILRLIEARARELPLPGGAVVIPVKEHHLEINSDLLSVLAVLTKCSASVWLRAKSPPLSVLKNRREVSLLIPPSFSKNIEELSR
ncbi:MAG: hypothetical protein VCF07_00235 [Nitrospinota bacterium]